MPRDLAEGERLPAIRRAFRPALAEGGTALIEDVSVPRCRMPEMFAVIAQMEEKYGFTIPTVAHAGDRNLYPNTEPRQGFLGAHRPGRTPA